MRFWVLHQTVILLALAIGQLGAPSLASAQRAGSPSALCMLAGLREIEESKTGALEEVDVPSRVPPLSVSKENSRFDFNVGVFWFKSSWTPDTISRLRLIAKRIKADDLGPDEVDAVVTELKDIRASFKFVRFLFNALSDDHEAPAAFDEIATAIGKLRDGLKREDPFAWTSNADRVLAALKPKSLRKVDKAISSFKPASAKDVNRWLAKTIDWTDKTLSKGWGTGEDWHQARKNLQAILSVYELALQKNPRNSGFAGTVKFLLTETERMGDEVGDHEQAVVDHDLNYNHDEVPYPSELVKKLRAFIKRLKASMQ